MEPNVAAEQYKAYMQDLGNIGTRYTTSNGFYLSVITALLGILSLMKRDQGLADLQDLLRIAVPVFAIGLCLVWRRSILLYAALFKAKLTVLKEIEKAGGLHPAFEGEYAKLVELVPSKKFLSANDARTPWLLALPFLVILMHTVWKLGAQAG